MVTMKCLIGSLAFDEQRYAKGDIFECSDEYSKKLIEHGYAVRISPISQPVLQIVPEIPKAETPKEPVKPKRRKTKYNIE